VNCVVAIVRVSVTADPSSRFTLLLLKNAVRPVIPDGATVLMATVPLKPRLPRVTVEDAEAPATKLEGVGTEAVIVKSELTLKVMVAEWDKPPTDPVIVTVYV
jgi:hypothetical protein